MHVHTECLSGDVFGSLVCHCGARLHRALDLIVDNGASVVIYLREDQTRRHSLQCAPARHELGDIESQILADLGVNPGATALLGGPRDASIRVTANGHQPFSDAVHHNVLSTNLPTALAV